MQRRFALDGGMRAYSRPYLLAVALERALELAAGAIEQRDGSAGLEAQHAREMHAGLLGEPDSLAGDERLLT